MPKTLTHFEHLKQLIRQEAALTADIAAAIYDARTVENISWNTLAESSNRSRSTVQNYYTQEKKRRENTPAVEPDVVPVDLTLLDANTKAAITHAIQTPEERTKNEHLD